MNVQAEANLPPETLEKRAAEERLRLHQSVGDLKESLTELKSSVEEKVRERLDVNKFARRHLWQLAAGASFVALLTGYGMAGMFTRR
jgi:hypothetical protein